MRSRTEKIKGILDRLYARYNRRELIKPDPLQFVYKFSRRGDKEIAGFLSAALAYGRVQQIEKSLNNLFTRMDDSPFDFAVGFNAAKRDLLKDFKHRFNTGDDISDLLELLGQACEKFGSIEELFLQGYHSQDATIVPALSRFCDYLLEQYTKRHKHHLGKGLSYLLTRPQDGSACKRLNLFLRWMVRDDDVDPGLWKSVDKTKLVVPVDVHMGRLCKILGLYKRKNVSLAAALEITQSFSKIEPDDPVKYDFALSRVGIIENCDGNRRVECAKCEIFEICSPV